MSVKTLFTIVDDVSVTLLFYEDYTVELVVFVIGTEGVGGETVVALSEKVTVKV